MKNKPEAPTIDHTNSKVYTDGMNKYRVVDHDTHATLWNSMPDEKQESVKGNPVAHEGFNCYKHPESGEIMVCAIQDQELNSTFQKKFIESGMLVQHVE